MKLANTNCRFFAWAALVGGLATAALGSSVAVSHVLVYRVTLNGAGEAPPNNSPGIGTATITFDLDLATMRVETSFSGLGGTTSAAHIHCCTATPRTSNVGVASQTPSFTGFPLGVTAGSYDTTFNLALSSSYNAAFITANGGTVSSALNALLTGAATGRAYLNIHTSAFGGGEIRGFLEPAPTLDLDQSETGTQYDATTDGLIALRYMLNLTGSALVTGAMGPTARRTDAAAVKAFMDGYRTSYDIDGNGSVDPATDGLLILRYLMGFRGTALTTGAVGSGASRSEPIDVANYILTLMP